MVKVRYRPPNKPKDTKTQGKVKSDCISNAVFKFSVYMMLIWN